jgi:hypothetical protein
LQGLLQKPQQSLTNRTEFKKLAKHQQDRLLHTAIRIFLPMLFFGFNETDRWGHEQLTPPCLFAARFQRTLA